MNALIALACFAFVANLALLILAIRAWFVASEEEYDEEFTNDK